MENTLLIVILINSILLIVAVLIQPSQKTGLIGDATDSEKRVRRGFDLFIFRATIFLIFTEIVFIILFGMMISGTFDLI